MYSINQTALQCKLRLAYWKVLWHDVAHAQSGHAESGCDPLSDSDPADSDWSFECERSGYPFDNDAFASGPAVSFLRAAGLEPLCRARRYALKPDCADGQGRKREHATGQYHVIRVPVFG